MIYTKPQIFLRETWRKAGARPEGLRIDCKTSADATRLRLALYAAVRRERKGEGEDIELIRIVGLIEIIKGENDCQLWLRDKNLNPMFQAITDATGMRMEDAEDPTIKASEERLMKEFGELSADDEPKAEKPNPFYEKR